MFDLYFSGNVPIIRSSKGNAAEMVAKKLDKKLRENLWDARNNLFHGNTGQAGSFSFTRPMLILLDRNMDMATPLHHTWTYQALAHDVLDLSLNRYVLCANVYRQYFLESLSIKASNLTRYHVRKVTHIGVVVKYNVSM